MALTFHVPTSNIPVGGIDEYTKLMLHMDGVDDGTVFTDDSESNHTVTRVNALTKTGTKKFGTAAGYFDGSGDYLTLPDSTDWNFGSDPFTIDFWYYCTTAGVGFLISRNNYTGPYDGWYLTVGTDAFRFVTNNNTNGGLTTESVPRNEWVHLALTYDGTRTYLFINGVLDGGIVLGSVQNYSTDVCIGCLHPSYINPQFFNGYIDELRISNTARWTSNFTPETGPYTE